MGKTKLRRQFEQMVVSGIRAETRLGLLEERIATDSLPEFNELVHTLVNWREEILNYFDYRITNGFVEGKNNRIKTIKRMAYPSREGP